MGNASSLSQEANDTFRIHQFIASLSLRLSNSVNVENIVPICGSHFGTCITQKTAEEERRVQTIPQSLLQLSPPYISKMIVKSIGRSKEAKQGSCEAKDASDFLSHVPVPLERVQERGGTHCG